MMTKDSATIEQFMECADGLNKSIQDYIDDCHKANRREVELPSIISTGLEFQTFKKKDKRSM